LGLEHEPKVEIDLGQVPRVMPDLKLDDLFLSPEEGFLFSRVDGSVNLGRLAHESGMDAGRALDVLNSLSKKGIITWDVAGSAGGGEPSEEEADGGMVFDPFELAEDVDLDEKDKKRILFLHTRMNEMTHYKILRVERWADSKEVKKAYFGVSKEFHPDTFFRKNIGSYKTKIEGIFKRISNAYEVLSNEQKRAAYDASLPYEPSPEEIEEQQHKEDLRQRDERLKEERRQRLMRRMPIGKQMARARRHLEEARKHREEGDLVQAANSAKIALVLDPDNEEIKRLHDEVNPKASEMRATKEFKRGQGEESMGRQEEALEAYLRAIEANPNDARPMLHAATLLLELNRDLRQGLTFCRMAKQLEPDNTKIVLTLGRIYVAMGMHKNAIREILQYVAQNPLDEQTAALLKELKKKAR